LKGRRLLRETNADDYAHVLVACLFHDIGYVRGILDGDSGDGYVIDTKGNKTELERGSSDATLMPYHVDRSKLFVMHRVAKSKLLDATRIANAIEFTRFPVSTNDIGNEEGMLVRAANIIGQLGDPHYLRKANALYYEFEEVGLNKQLGYDSPADLTESSRRLSKARSGISMSHQADGNGSPTYTAIFSAPTARLTERSTTVRWILGRCDVRFGSKADIASYRSPRPQKKSARVESRRQRLWRS
jgi:hypothetical protein